MSIDRVSLKHPVIAERRELFEDFARDLGHVVSRHGFNPQWEDDFGEFEVYGSGVSGDAKFSESSEKVNGEYRTVYRVVHVDGECTMCAGTGRLSPNRRPDCWHCDGTGLDRQLRQPRAV